MNPTAPLPAPAARPGLLVITSQADFEIRFLAVRSPVRTLYFPLSCLLWSHVKRVDAGHGFGFPHGVASEGFAQFLIQQDLDKRRHAILHLGVDGSLQFNRHRILHDLGLAPDVVRQRSDREELLHACREDGMDSGAIVL